MKTNGAVIMTRELRVRISPAHQRSLEGLAKMHGWQGPTALAEALLTKAIEDAARNTAQTRFVDILIDRFQRARFR